MLYIYFSVSYYSNNDLRNITVFASPAVSRRNRNVYTQQDKFWMLKKEGGKEDPEALQKISHLQQQVSILCDSIIVNDLYFFR